MITERRQLRKAISEILNDYRIENQGLTERLADKALEVIDETRPRHKVTGEDAQRIFRKVTGMVVIPPAGAMQAIEIISAMVREYGEEETTKRMGAAWAWWRKQITKDGKPYGLTNMAWLDYALTGIIPQQQQKRRSPLGV